MDERLQSALAAVASPAPSCPQGRWIADCGVSGWCLRWELGRASVYVPVNQWGCVKSATSQYCELDFAGLQRRLKGAGVFVRRCGSRHSRERRARCEQIADYFNSCDIPLVRPVPDAAS